MKISGDKWRSTLDVVATIVMIVAALGTLAMVGLNHPGSEPSPAPRKDAVTDVPVPSEPLSLSGAQVRGSRDAKLAMIVYSDFQCPFCRKLAREILPALIKKYVDPGIVQLAFRNYPMEFHQFAKRAAEDAACAGQQGHFWEAHDLIFREQPHLDDVWLRALATRLSLDPERFGRCVDSDGPAIVMNDVANGKGVHIIGTPTSFIGTVAPDGRVTVSRAIGGAQPAVAFETVLDEVVSGLTPRTVGRN